MKLIWGEEGVDGWVDLEQERMGNMAEVAKENFIHSMSWPLGRFYFSYITSHPHSSSL